MSRTLSKTQQNYSTFDRELLAIFLNIRHFQHFLEGRTFTIYTDHKPLTFALSSSSNYNQRQLRQLSEISEYSAPIVHKAGKDNIVADTLSRPNFDTIAHVMTDVSDDLRFMAQEQINDPFCQSLLSDNIKSDIRVHKLTICDQTQLTLICDNSQDIIRPIVPVKMVPTIIQKYHDISHPGVQGTLELIKSKYVWKFMAKDVKKFVQNCLPCQAIKVDKHTKAPIQEFKIPPGRFAHIHVDIVGPLPTFEGFKYIFTAIDRWTRFPIAVPMPDSTTENCIKVFLNSWVSYFGVPEQLVTDRGTQFTSHLWRDLMRSLGIRHNLTTAYHPQSNGIVERFHRQLKQALKCKVAQKHLDWPNQLPLILLSLRSTPKQNLDTSPAELVFGQAPRLPGYFIDTMEIQPPYHDLLHTLHKTMNQISFVPPAYHGEPNSYLPPNMYNAKFIFVRNKDPVGFMPTYAGPFRVLKSGRKFFKVMVGSKIDSISVDRIKPAYSDEE